MGSCWWKRSPFLAGEVGVRYAQIFKRVTRAALIVRRGICTIVFRCCPRPGERRNDSSHRLDAFAMPSVAKCVLLCAFDFVVRLFWRCYAKAHTCELPDQRFLLNHSICSYVVFCLRRQSLIDIFCTLMCSVAHRAVQSPILMQLH